MYIGVSKRDERLILEALAALLRTKDTKIKPRLMVKGSKIEIASLVLRSYDDATVKENFEYFCKILGLRQEKLKFFDSGIGHSVIFALSHDVIRVYAVQNFGKDNMVREFEKGVKSVYPMTSKIKDYLYESTVDCPSVERFLAALAVPFKLITKSESYAEIKFKSITVYVSRLSGSQKTSKLLLQYSGV